MSGARPSRGGLALALGLSILVAPARGEDAPSRARDGAPEFTLDEVVVRVPRSDAAPGSAVTVVDAERFAGESKSVAELVGTAPGVAVNDYGGLGRLATVTIRGSTADGVKVLLDGLPLNGAAGGGVNLSSIPRQWISTIEVVRGAEGARYGAGALGGAVNVVTRAPRDGAWSSSLSYGSFGTVSAGAEAASGGERWGALLSLGLDATDGDFRYRFDDRPSDGSNAAVTLVRRNNAGRSGGGLAKGFVDVAGGRLDVLGQLSGGMHELPGWPFALTPHDRQSDLRGASTARFARPLSERLFLRTELVLRHDRLATRVAGLNGTASQRETDGAVTVALAALAGRHRAELGTTVGGARLDGDGFGPPRDRAELAAFASDEVALAGGRVRLAPSARVERLGGFEGWSAKLGADAAIAGPWSARASAGRTFRAPSFTELYLQQGILQPNPDLHPEDGWSADVGLAAEGRLGVARATAFASLYRDLIVYEPASFQRLKPFNAARAAVRGVEVETASAPVGPLGLSGSVGYTLLASENLRGDASVLGKDLPRRPGQRLFLRGAGSRGPLEAHVELHHVGAQWQDRRNLIRIPSATTLNAGASWRFLRHPDVALHVDVRNALDTLDLQDPVGNPLPGRMLLVGLRAGSTTGTP